ncbi:transmembrane protein, putative (macronuclear) [Tetrahymena thermophila SB210]|uniref:Transmembrane protein, putative n=1 Tax=Tetrahymena thermophila (strain SB210) TaxID=312017 RepID=Q22AU3_TETTS|nr:transmembrane protein, putative [Tetrahymena thermophila SB210]EAR82405.2 transmembrane protein, putative [Tetrahymena thermophila SB210]|eukprot:XP_001030068.2 transmembrane protein, putative [Tetrahymena thermophila SB210]
MFGARISLKYNSNSTHQTCWGAIVSLSIIAYLLYQFLLQAENLLQGKNFQLVYSENSEEEPKQAKISASEFPLALGIKQNDFSSSFLQRESFNVEGIQFSIQRVLNNQTNQYEFQTVQESFSLEPCSESSFQIQEIASEIKKYPLNYLYCIPSNSSYSLQGQPESNTYKFLKFKISYCKSQLNCSESLQNQQQTSLYTIYVNRIIDADRLEDQLLPMVQSMQWTASSGTKRIDLRFKNAYVNSQIGTLFQSIQSQQKLLFSSDKELITDYNKNNMLFELNLSLENNKESIYNIKQQTLVQFFSSIGGLVNCFYFIGLILAMPASKFSYNQKLLNSIFNFQLDQNQQESSQQESPQIYIDNQKSQITENNTNTNNNNNTVNHSNNNNNRSILKQNFKFKFNRSHTIQTAQTARDPLNSNITHKAYNNSIFRKNNLHKESEDQKDEELGGSNSISQKIDINQNEIQLENKQNKEQTTVINQYQTLNDFSTLNLNDIQLSSQKRQDKLNDSFCSAQEKKHKIANTSQFCQNQDGQIPFKYIRRCETQKLEDLAFTDHDKRNEDESKNIDDKYSNCRQRRVSQQVQINTDHTQSKTINQSKNQNQIAQNKQNLITQMSLLKNTIKIKIQDQLLSIFCKKKIKSRMINYGIEKINDFLDINMFIKTIVEFQKLKRILMNKDQLILFELIPPPLIHEQQFTNKISDEENEKECYSAFNTGMVFEDYRTQIKKMKDAQSSYNRIFKSSNTQHSKPSFVDNQILLYIGQNLKKQFDENTFR